MDSAQTTYDRIVQMKKNEATMASLSSEYNAEAYEKNISDLQYQLNQQVSLAVQNAINTLTANGEKIDTMEELSAIKGTIFQEMDKSIANIAISNQAQRKLIIDRYNEVIATSEEQAKNKNIVNEQVSKAQGIYIDGNGNPMVDLAGNTIPYTGETKTIYDSDTGQLVQYDEAGNFKVKQVSKAGRGKIVNVTID